MGGITTLSSDSRAIVSPGASRFSLYEPDNGPTFWLIGGRHFNDYFSAQVSYAWNCDRLCLTASKPALGVAVGIDLALGRGWAFRYIFGEALKTNPISNELAPSGEHNMKKFQNLSGIVKSF